jgi:hypothetical protein
MAHALSLLGVSHGAPPALFPQGNPWTKDSFTQNKKNT